MNVIVYDGDFTTASAVRAPVYSSPLPHTNERLILRQEFEQLASSFSPEALNTAHPDASSFKLVEESDGEAIGGGLIRWTRTYAKVPSTWSEPAGNIAYNFIGLVGVWGVNVDEVTGRERFTLPVQVKVTREYFLTGTGGSYTTGLDIPVIQEQRYIYINEWLPVDYLSDSPPYETPTTPSSSEYAGMVDAGELIVIEPSLIYRWLGQIFVRETRYVRAR